MGLPDLETIEVNRRRRIAALLRKAGRVAWRSQRTYGRRSRRGVRRMTGDRELERIYRRLLAEGWKPDTDAEATG